MKRNEMLAALQELLSHPENQSLSNVKLGEMIGLSPSFVANHRGPRPEVVLGKDGNTMNTSKIGQNSKVTIGSKRTRPLSETCQTIMDELWNQGVRPSALKKRIFDLLEDCR